LYPTFRILPRCQIAKSANRNFIFISSPHLARARHSIPIPISARLRFAAEGSKQKHVIADRQENADGRPDGADHVEPKARNAARNPSNGYWELVVELPLISIKSETQRAAAQAMLDRLLARGKLDEGRKCTWMRSAISLRLTKTPIVRLNPASDADMLRHLLDAKGISQAELHRQTGIPKSTISEVLAGKKPI